MVKSNLDVILALAALIGISYRVFQIEAAIYNAIKNLKESLSERIALSELQFGVHMAAYAERKEQVDYLIHANDEKIDHKANRLIDEIKQLKLELKYKSKFDEG